MDADQFSKIVEMQMQRCFEILTRKASEYATEDRLHNFKTAAVLSGVTPKQALAGMMAKHTVSIYDMLSDGAAYPTAVWDEKITDHLNYLLLLTALLVEENGK